MEPADEAWCFMVFCFRPGVIKYNGHTLLQKHYIIHEHITYTMSTWSFHKKSEDGSHAKSEAQIMLAPFCTLHKKARTRSHVKSDAQIMLAPFCILHKKARTRSHVKSDAQIMLAPFCILHKKARTRSHVKSEAQINYVRPLLHFAQKSEDGSHVKFEAQIMVARPLLHFAQKKRGCGLTESSRHVGPAPFALCTKKRGRVSRKVRGTNYGSPLLRFAQKSEDGSHVKFEAQIMFAPFEGYAFRRCDHAPQDAH